MSERFVDPLPLTPYPVDNFPLSGDDNRYSVILGDDGNLYVSDGVQWNQVGSGSSSGGAIAGTSFNAFRYYIQNVGGTLMHSFSVPGYDQLNFPGPDALTAPGINSPSNDLIALPRGPLASTAFSGGAMSPTDGDYANAIILDTADVAFGKLAGVITTSSNNSSFAKAITILDTETVNGVSRRRVYFIPKNSTDGAPGVGSLSSGQRFTMDFIGYLPDYA
jgi:hypothetical protein